jgi:dienelactone hydrolase
VRLLEIVLLVVLALASLRLLVPAWHRAAGWGRLLAAAAVAAAGLHALIEGPRWQLIPAYVLAAVLAGVALRRPAPRDGRLPRVGGALALVATLVAAALAWALPIPRFGPTTGDLDVATTSFRLLDPTRDERYTDDPDDAREVVVQAWYPTRDRGETAPVVRDGVRVGAIAADWLDLPPVTLSHIGLVRTRSVDGGSIATGRGSYPVVVISHGWGGFRSIHVDLAEDLASQGYVVLAVDHTYGSLATEFPDGPVVAIEPDALPADAAPADYDTAAATLEGVFASDLRLLLDHLETEGNAERFAGLLDLTRVAFVGHSTGGGAAVTACARDERCDAVVGLDPWLEPVPEDVLTQGLDVPVLAVFSAEWVGNASDQLMGRLAAASTGETTRLSLAGTSHRDVTLLPLLSPLASELGLAGPTGGERVHTIVEAYVSSFLDAALRDGGGGLLRADPPYPEVTRTP